MRLIRASASLPGMLGASVLHIDDQVRMPGSALSHSGFRAWATSPDFPEKIHATYFAGEVLIEMSPESLEAHNKVKAALTITLGNIIASEDLGESWIDGALLTNESAALSTEPDFSFASWATLESGRLSFVSKANQADEFIELVGTPDLVVEVVSDSSVKKGLEWLRAAYARAQIPEYWLIDARGPAIQFEILTLQGDAYRAPSFSGGWQRSFVLGRAFELVRTVHRLRRFSYTLQTG